MPAPAIEFRDVSFARPGQARVLDHFTLTVEAGDVLALVGRSGAGKSTLLKLVNRLLVPDTGSVLVEGRDTREWQPIALRRNVGYVLQDVGLFPHMSIADNVAIVPRLEHWSAERIAERTRELLDLVGLPANQFATGWPDELSGGQRQRVGVARALAVDPPVLLMDEPFGALDPITRARLQQEMRRLHAEVAKTIVFVTHDIDEAITMGDRIAILREGGVLAQYDSPDAILAHPADAFVEAFVGEDRALRRLALRTLGDVPLQAVSGDGPRLAVGTSLRNAVSQMLEVDADQVVVIGDDGKELGILRLDDVPSVL